MPRLRAASALAVVCCITAIFGANNATRQVLRVRPRACPAWRRNRSQRTRYPCQVCRGSKQQSTNTKIRKVMSRPSAALRTESP
jgi:hypothetical protein